MPEHLPFKLRLSLARQPDDETFEIPWLQIPPGYGLVDGVLAKAG
jgi:hypothetical protein